MPSVQHDTDHAAVFNQAFRRLDALQRVLKLGCNRLVTPWQPAKVVPGVGRYPGIKRTVEAGGTGRYLVDLALRLVTASFANNVFSILT